jgi:hypothetical protein
MVTLLGFPDVMAWLMGFAGSAQERMNLGSLSMLLFVEVMSRVQMDRDSPPTRCHENMGAKSTKINFWAHIVKLIQGIIVPGVPRHQQGAESTCRDPLFRDTSIISPELTAVPNLNSFANNAHFKDLTKCEKMISCNQVLPTGKS